MKLPDFQNFHELDELRRRMGIAPNVYGRLEVAVNAARLTPDELDRLISPEGLDIASLDDIRVLDDGTLAFKNSRILLYIRDHTVYGNRHVDPKFHIANCETLREMKRISRFARYVVAARLDGTFKVNLIEGKRRTEDTRRLAVCQNCMNFLEFDGFHMNAPRLVRMRMVQSFVIERFFQKYPRTLHVTVPEGDSDNTPVNDYTQDFSATSNSLRAAANWTCENLSCKARLHRVEHRRFLHVHHLNGVKSDDRPQNHRILCIECHANEPNHGHMRSLQEYRTYLAIKHTI